MATRKKSTAEAAAPKTETTPGHRIVIKGFGPGPEQDGHGDWDVTLPLGISEIAEKNGAGKTRGFYCPLAKALNQAVDVPVELRYGSSEGYVEIDGRRLWTLTKPTHEKRDVELWLQNESSPLIDVICPDVKNPSLAEPRRVEAVLKLVKIAVTEDAVRLLAGAEEAKQAIAEAGDNVADRLFEIEPKILEKSIVDVSEMAIKVAHGKKREWEDRAQVLSGEIKGLGVDGNETLPKPEKMSELSVSDADQAYRDAIGEHREKEGGWKQRQERERERVEIEATLGDRPSADGAQERYNVNEKLVKDSEIERADIESQIRVLQVRLESVRVRGEEAATEKTRCYSEIVKITQDAARWDKRKAILDAEITGSTETDVKTAAAGVQAASDELSAARDTEDYRKRCVVLEGKQKERNTALDRAQAYERVAKSVRSRLSQILQGAGLEHLTVEGGILQYRHADDTLEPFKSLSEGERWKVGIRELILRNPPPLGILPMPRRAIDSLDAKNREEINKFLVEQGLSVVIEQPGE